MDREDSYRHSKWLSFMHKRLTLARTLLKPEGVIFISIDNNEQAQLKLLCDQVFGEANFVGNIIWKNVTDNNPTNIATEHEYIYCYSKQREYLPSVWKSIHSPYKEILLEKESELLSKYSTHENLQKSYTNWFKENKQFLGELDRYKYIDKDGIYTGSQSVHNPGKEGYRYDVFHPVTGKPCKQPLMGYRFPETTMKGLLENGRILFGENENKIIELKVYAKDYQAKLSSLFELDGRIGANELRALFWESSKVFTNPKPTTLIIDILSFTTQKNALILDFFAGSGTTLHAVMALNAEDGGNRQCILVTNNENNIAEEVCYERNRRVIQGYRSSKGVAVPGLTANHLHYYQTVYVGRERTLTNKRALMQMATELIQIREGCFVSEEKGGEDVKTIRLFTNDRTGMPDHGMPDHDRYVVVIYNEDAIDTAVTLIDTLPPTTNKIRVYVFAPGFYPYTDDFADVADRIELTALPDAIYQAYGRLLPPAGTPSNVAEDAETDPAVPETPLSLFSFSSPSSLQE